MPWAGGGGAVSAWNFLIPWNWGGGKNSRQKGSLGSTSTEGDDDLAAHKNFEDKIGGVLDSTRVVRGGTHKFGPKQPPKKEVVWNDGSTGEGGNHQKKRAVLDIESLNVGSVLPTRGGGSRVGEDHLPAVGEEGIRRGPVDHGTAAHAPAEGMSYLGGRGEQKK